MNTEVKLGIIYEPINDPFCSKQFNRIKILANLYTNKVFLKYHSTTSMFITISTKNYPDQVSNTFLVTNTMSNARFNRFKYKTSVAKVST